jgi:hypothetical protein
MCIILILESLTGVAESTEQLLLSEDESIRAGHVDARLQGDQQDVELDSSLGVGATCHEGVDSFTQVGSDQGGLQHSQAAAGHQDVPLHEYPGSDQVRVADVQLMAANHGDPASVNQSSIEAEMRRFSISSIAPYSTPDANSTLSEAGRY